MRLKAVKLGVHKPQWSPVMKTGNTSLDLSERDKMSEPQWSPVMKTGNTVRLDHVEDP